MEHNFNIDEILAAVNDLQNRKKERKIGTKEIKAVKKDNSDIPVNTLRLIEEAEKIEN
tara:strand:- start:1048 stop:1221 length:174 start_codon:yes stop_codon:yes gene_type:complete